MNVPNDAAQRLLDRIPSNVDLDKALHERGLTLTGAAWSVLSDLNQLTRGVNMVSILSRSVVKE